MTIEDAEIANGSVFPDGDVRTVLPDNLPGIIDLDSPEGFWLPHCSKVDNGIGAWSRRCERGSRLHGEGQHGAELEGRTTGQEHGGPSCVPY